MSKLLKDGGMNKGELVSAIAAKASLTKKDIDTVLGAGMEVIMEAVAAGEKVVLVGFGTFQPKERKAREGRNPSTGAPIKIPAARVPGFAPGKEFKDKVFPKS